MSEILAEIARILEERKGAAAQDSYVASLYAGAPDAILKKIGEEATEVVIAGKAAEQSAVIHEIADLWFHSLILLAHMDLGPDDVLGELKRRFGRSGLDEKAGRK